MWGLLCVKMLRALCYEVEIWSKDYHYDTCWLSSSNNYRLSLFWLLNSVRLQRPELEGVFARLVLVIRNSFRHIMICGCILICHFWPYLSKKFRRCVGRIPWIVDWHPRLTPVITTFSKNRFCVLHTLFTAGDKASEKLVGRKMRFCQNNKIWLTIYRSMR